MLKRQHRTVKKAADKILYKRKRNEGNELKDISDRDVTDECGSIYDTTNCKHLAR